MSRNLLTVNQTGIETDTTGWAAASNTTISRSTAQAFAGSASLAVVAANTNDMQAFAWNGVSITASAVPVVAGVPYTLTLQMRAATVGKANQALINWYNAAGSFLSQSAGSATADTTSGWTQKTCAATAPSTAAYALVGIYIGESPHTAGETHYIDEITFTFVPSLVAADQRVRRNSLLRR